MAGDTSTTLANFFKTFYRDYMGTDVPNASEVGRMIEKEAREIPAGGTSLNTTWTNKSYDGVGFGTLTDGGDYPGARASGPLQYSLGLAHLAFTVSFTGHAQAMGSSSRAGWLGKKLAKEKGTELRDKARSLLARFLMHDGTTTWGTVSAVETSTAEYIEVTGIPIHMFVKGELLTIRDTASGGSEQLTGGATSGTIVDPDFNTDTAVRIYITDAAGAAINDIVSLANVYDTTVPNGLRNIVAKTGAIQGHTRTTASKFMLQSTVRDASSTSLTAARIDELRDAVDDVAKLRNGRSKTKWVCNRKMRRWMTQATIGQNRFTSLDMTIGNPSMKVGDKDGDTMVVEDPFVYDGELYAVDFSKLVKTYPEGMRGGYPVENAAGGVLWQANASSGTGHSDTQFMYWVVRCNFGADDFRSLGKDTNLVAP